MLNIDIFDDFISVGAKRGISKYASAIMNQDFSNGMSGYDIEEMVKIVAMKSESDILQYFSLDSEYGMFCMYYKHNAKGLALKEKTTNEAISKCTEYVTLLNELIKKEYINAVMADLDTKPTLTHIS